MADKKISQLTAASTPLAGTEVLPIVQSGSTVKVSIANVTAGRSVATGPITASVADNGGISIAQSIAGETGFLNFVDSDAGLAGRVKYDHSNNSLQFFSNALERVRIDSSGNVKNNSGNFILGTAAKGVSFPENTPAAGMTSQLLNWYEEGTWTPTLTCGDGNFNSVTYDPLRGGRYTRVGNMVHVQCYMRTDAVDNTVGRAGDVLIAGLPFAAVTATSGTLNGHSSLAVSAASTWAGEEPLAAFISGGDTNIQLLYRSAVDGNTANVVAADVGTGANANIVLIAGTYICA